MKNYTVVGVYESNNQVTVEHVEAGSPKEAFQKTEEDCGPDWSLVSIFDGHLMDLSSEL